MIYNLTCIVPCHINASIVQKVTFIVKFPHTNIFNQIICAASSLLDHKYYRIIHILNSSKAFLSSTGETHILGVTPFCSLSTLLTSQRYEAYHVSILHLKFGELIGFSFINFGLTYNIGDLFEVGFGLTKWAHQFRGSISCHHHSYVLSSTAL